MVICESHARLLRGHDCPYCTKAELEAENQKLREALEKIATDLKPGWGARVKLTAKNALEDVK